MNESDDDALHALRTNSGERRDEFRLVQFAFRAAVGEHPLGDAEYQIAGDQRLWPRAEQRVHLRHAQTRQLDDVLESRRRDEGETRALTLDNRIDTNRRAVNEGVDIRRVDAVALLKERQPLHQLTTGLFGCGEHL